MTVYYCEQLWSATGERWEYRFARKATALRDLHKANGSFARGLVERVDDKAGTRKIIATLGEHSGVLGV